MSSLLVLSYRVSGGQGAIQLNRFHLYVPLATGACSDRRTRRVKPEALRLRAARDWRAWPDPVRERIAVMRSTQQDEDPRYRGKIW